MCLIIALGQSCKPDSNTSNKEEEIWKLGWRMIESSWNEDFTKVDQQFDSLQNMSDRIDDKFLITGIEAKIELSRIEAAVHIISLQSDEFIRNICDRNLVRELEICVDVPSEKVQKEELKLEIIKMLVDDQAVRGNLETDLIAKYNIDTTTIITDDISGVDLRNRTRLMEITEEYGFPTRELIGKEGMDAIFLFIQHADMDKEWQKSQLPNIENAVKQGDLDGASYAYLYDRIKINSGNPQRYGTQFSMVDPVNKTVELAATEDLENLDQRRREKGMMPIELYKKVMLRNF